jgi:phosphoinositide-3-kinase regulatory subunit 4
MRLEQHNRQLLEDPETSVRHAFLGSLSVLCFAFGSAKVGDVGLSQLNTYPNDWV